jgi:hypothetical protein
MRRVIRIGGVGVVGAALGLLVGALIGGNCAVDFQLAGLRGYEATGDVGAVVGFALGAGWAGRRWRRAGSLREGENGRVPCGR